MKFEWDNQKARDNLRRHGIAFEVAAGVFLDANRIEGVDDREDYGEERFFTIGAIDLRIIYVAYTMRGGRIRLISARKATKRERERYESI